MADTDTLDNLETVLKKFRDGDIDPITRIFWDLNAETILESAIENSQKGAKVLDVGCGVGNYLIELNKIERECIGVDPLWGTSLIKAQERAKTECADIALFRANGEHLPLKEHLFDMVLYISSLQHVNDQYQTLHEIKRVLNSSGLLLVSVPQTIRKSTFLKNDLYTMHFNLDILKNVLNDCGFKVLKIKGCGFVKPITANILGPLFPIFGYKITKKMMSTFDFFAKYMPQYVSSIIILAEVTE